MMIGAPQNRIDGPPKVAGRARYAAGQCSVTIEGKLDEESCWVFDFVALKGIMRRLCDQIDHKVLLPLDNPRLQR